MSQYKRRVCPQCGAATKTQYIHRGEYGYRRSVCTACCWASIKVKVQPRKVVSDAVSGNTRRPVPVRREHLPGADSVGRCAARGVEDAGACGAAAYGARRSSVGMPEREPGVRVGDTVRPGWWKRALDAIRRRFVD